MISYTKSCKDIKADFENNKIPIISPGFYNHPNFTLIEKQNPSYLNNYARYVQCLDYSNEYLIDAEKKIGIVVEKLYEEIKSDGRLGACFDASGILAQILENLGVWCYQVKGSLTIQYPDKVKLPTNFFHSIIAPSEPQTHGGHSWLVAPPFTVMDLTLKLQKYLSKCYRYLPEYILEKHFNETSEKTEELCSPQALKYYSHSHGLPKANLHLQVASHLAEFFPLFPSNLVKFNHTKLKFTPTAITATEGTLKDNQTFSPNGKSGIEIYEQVILPCFQ